MSGNVSRTEQIVMGVPVGVGIVLYAANALHSPQAVQDVEDAQSDIRSVDEFFDEQEPGHPSYDALTTGNHTVGDRMVELAQSPPADPTEYRSLVYRLYRENTYVQQRSQAMAELATAQNAVDDHNRLTGNLNISLFCMAAGVLTVGLRRLYKEAFEDSALL